MGAFSGDSLNDSVRALLEVEPEELLRRLSASGLRGRGGGSFETARKWHAVRIEGGVPLVVANGAEGEPGSIKDRYLMRTRPAEVLTGLALAARALGAREGIVFLKQSFVAEAQAIARALEDGAATGIAVKVRHGDDSYIVGEETALLESLEGRRPWPRPKPPLPSAVGFAGRPTLVQNVETLARVPLAVADPEGYRASETTWVSLWGHVRRPGVYEVPLKKSLAQIIDEEGGGAREPVGLVFPGGPSAPPLGPENLNTLLDPDALRAAGSGLGTASMLVVGASVDPRAVAVALAAFFEREACGQCPPCVMGTGSLHRIARARRVEARTKDPSELREVAGFMAMHGYCAHCRTAASSVTGLLARADRAVSSRPAVAGSAGSDFAFDPFSPHSEERAAIERTLG
jgi:NADH-quinone oxidoreductase subunit F